MKIQIMIFKSMQCCIQNKNATRLLLTILGCCWTAAHAGLMTSSTRVILYERSDHLQTPHSITLANRNAYPIVSQVWVDHSDTSLTALDSHVSSQATANNSSLSTAANDASNITSNNIHINAHTAAISRPRIEIFPAIFKLQPNEIKTLQILQLSNTQDLNDSFTRTSVNKVSQLAHSLFQTKRSTAVLQEQQMWLNLLEMPLDADHTNQAKDAEQHHMHVLMNTQLKVFYRPKGLVAKDIHQREKALQFHPIFNTTEQRQQQSQPITRAISAIEVENTTGYYITFARLELNAAKQAESLHHPDMMLAPFQRKRFSLNSTAIMQAQSIDLIRYVLIDDEGEYRSFERRLNN